MKSVKKAFVHSVAEPHHFYAAPAPVKIFWCGSMQLRLRLLPYFIVRQNFQNELKFKHMVKLSCSSASVRFTLQKIWIEWVINYYILCHFSMPNPVKYHCRSRRNWSRSRIALRLRLRPNDAAPCGSGSGSAILFVQCMCCGDAPFLCRSDPKAPAPALAPTLLYSKPTYWKQT
jgi:hypothetical protein